MVIHTVTIQGSRAYQEGTKVDTKINIKEAVDPIANRVDRAAIEKRNESESAPDYMGCASYGEARQIHAHKFAGIRTRDAPDLEPLNVRTRRHFEKHRTSPSGSRDYLRDRPISSPSTLRWC
ncbi:hypothetical protein RHA1_ro08594 (plasmid) [Rhodococcus jostii RHA1]|uniref:Uncharacterized protein n=1 Tax=Rhodococcus jostii (strain RHA1) TaxID=101510 RepID=Q0RYJ8_RHOJR|nr:hypothetical protein RHA1_ro08594 [Rhodococcus jostii RHA1]